MRKLLPFIMVLLVICFFLPGVALASDGDWQIQWQDNGTLQEQVKISGKQVAAPEKGWVSSQEGNSLILKREVKNWQSYKNLEDKLPLDIKQTNYIVVGITELTVNKGLAAGTVFSQFNNLNNFKIRISVPGIIVSSTGKQVDDFSTEWSFNNSVGLLQQDSILKVISFDGFLLGIVIVGLGLVVVLIMFTARLRKVDKFIDEEYSLENINLDDLDETDTDNKKEKQDPNP